MLRLSLRFLSALALAVVLACDGGSPTPGPAPGGGKDAGSGSDAGSDGGSGNDGGSGGDGGTSCTGAQTACGTACVDLTKDSENCGSCNHACGANETCANSACVAACGDGKVDASAETCDDGNTNAGDGCSATCTAEQGFTCSGSPSTCKTTCGDGVTAGAEACDDGNIKFNDGCSSSCAIENGYACTGTPSVCAPVCGDGKIIGVEDCDDGNIAPGDGCSATCLLEPGWLCNGEPTTCQTLCGDGITAGAEQCDDGNAASNDGCSSTCVPEPGYSCAGSPSVCVTGCGDGAIAATEGCDDGNTIAGDGCSPICQLENGFHCMGAPSTCATTCGDGIRAGAEACDDFNLTNGDGCNASCLIEPGYTCTGSPSTCTSGCGDGVKTGSELCDDGNTMSGDGCSATCFVETGYTCSGSPSVCATVCGDGNVIPGKEACDDGNLSSGDGCSATCAVEPGYQCAMTSPSMCAPICGDGKVIAGKEACDDGNQNSGDGCSDLCAVESGYACMGMPSTCATVCGDGVKKGTEACDDGNTMSGDCCSSTCTLEPGCEIEPNNTDASANAFSSVSVAGQVKGFISPANTDKDVYGVSVTANAQLIAETLNGPLGAQCTAKQIDTRIVVRDSTGAQIPDTAGTADDVSVSTNWCSKYVSSALTAGSYFVEVARSGFGGPVNDYTLKITVKPPVCGNGVVEAGEACDDGNMASGDGCSSTCAWEIQQEVEANDAAATANTIALNKLVGGAVSPGTDLDFFKFTLSATSDLVIETFDPGGPPNCSIDTRIQLLASNGTTVLATDDDSGLGACSKLEAPIAPSVTHLAAGTYYVRVDGKGAVVPGYTLLVRATATCGNGKIEGSEQCDGQANCTATCDRVVTCGDGYVDGSETCDDGNTTSGDGCSATCAMEAITEIEPNDSQSQADSSGILISGSKHVQGNLPTTSDLDTFKLTVASQSVVRLETFGTKIGDCPIGLNTQVTLYDSAFATIATNSTGGVLSCSALVENLAAGTYYVRVQRSGGTVTAYVLDVVFENNGGAEVEVNDTQPAASPVTGSDVYVFGGHQTGTDEDWFAVNVPAGKSLRAEVIEGSTAETCESGGIDSTLDLFDAAGNRLESVDDLGRGKCSLIDGTGALPVKTTAHDLNPGTYFLRVSASRAATGGANQFDYRLVVTVRQ